MGVGGVCWEPGYVYRQVYFIDSKVIDPLVILKLVNLINVWNSSVENIAFDTWTVGSLRIVELATACNLSLVNQGRWVMGVSLGQVDVAPLSVWRPKAGHIVVWPDHVTW